jgi:beta-lactamase regulating signal transducer with metallopeptidase domain
MNEVAAVLVPALGTALLHFLWQGALIGLIAWLLLLLLRNARPQARYAVACIALLACVAAPLSSVCLAFLGGGAAETLPATGRLLADAASTGSTPASIHPALPAPPAALLPWVVALWAVGTSLLSLRMAGGVLWVRRLCRDARADTDGRWQACVDRLAARMHIGRKVALQFTDRGDSPLSAGWWRPVVLLPMAVAARMPASLLEALIAHELAHTRRHDYLINLLQGVVEALLFYHPVVWWLSRRIREERELVADDLAATALGERRKLALALSELDRMSLARSPLPPFQLAQAAHGGQLMSRIRQLVRPHPQAPRRPGTIVLPLLALAAAGIAFYANARIANTPSGFVRTTSASVVAQPVALAQAAAPAARATPAPAARPVARISIGNRGNGDSYALVRKGEEGIAMSGSSDDIEQIRAAQGSIDGDFLWFRRDGKAWVVRDADTLARARQAWAPTEALNSEMQALNARMQPHSEKLEALSARMESLSEGSEQEAPEMRAASEQMEALGEQMGELGERQAVLGAQLASADDSRRAQLESEMEALGAQQEALGAQMERHSTVMETASRRMEQQHAPMEALGREMEAASRPMEGIGKEMEKLGGRIEQQAKLADGQVRRLIDDAFERGLASPAPAQQ